MANDVKDIRAALARAIANRRVPESAVEEVANQIATLKHPIRGIDVCERGICIDYFVDSGDWQQAVSEITPLEGGRLRGIEIFPWGIIIDDLVQIRVIQQFEAIEQFGT